MSVEARSEGPRRRNRRRAETSGRLLTAARELFAEKGVDATRINEITERADLGFGSFYTYFDDKEAIVEAVLQQITEEHGSGVDAMTADLEDPAEVFAVASRYFLRLASIDPVWAQLMLRLEVSHGVLARVLRDRALRDFQLGIDAGRFHIDDLAMTVRVTGGALLGAMAAVLEGASTGDADQRYAELVLRMVGVPRGEAAELARRPLPALISSETS